MRTAIQPQAAGHLTQPVCSQQIVLRKALARRLVINTTTINNRRTICFEICVFVGVCSSRYSALLQRHCWRLRRLSAPAAFPYRNKLRSLHSTPFQRLKRKPAGSCSLTVRHSTDGAVTLKQWIRPKAGALRQVVSKTPKATGVLAAGAAI